MLKQQLTETQGPSPLLPDSATAQTVAESTETVQPATVTSPKLKVASRRLPPLYLSRWHWSAVLCVPLLYALVVVTGHRVPVFLRYTDNAAMMQVFLVLILPVVLCVLLGSYLRSLRAAFLSGVLMGLSCIATDWVTRQLSVYAPALFVRPLGHFVTNLKEAIIALLVFAFFAVASAAVAQSKHGRRTLHDRDLNR